MTAVKASIGTNIVTCHFIALAVSGSAAVTVKVKEDKVDLTHEELGYEFTVINLDSIRFTVHPKVFLCSETKP